jgi:dTDP-4-dehydrorhamnose reductase
MSASRLSVKPLELWGGVECTVNRVGDTYYDQLERSGHSVRIGDLDRLANLGVRTLRYPVLWERVVKESNGAYDWCWADERLRHLQKLGITPIVGLLHHGSGPHHTNLLDPQFPEKFSDFAIAVARRYPWVDHYTPINEPLTTARFSCLYGHWYPHERDPLKFAQAVLNQCRAIKHAMRGIREVNPRAKLIQTEDLGCTYSTQTLAYQADFENERRWLTFDLLCAQVQPGTLMWDHFLWLGIAEKELSYFIDSPSPPELIGINYYITSERFLDERLTRYPSETHGGNGRHHYSDVEAVRVCAEGLRGPKSIIKEAWDRYRLPLAITEAHLCCTREEQLRWFKEVWDSALELSKGGIDVRAVTAWSAFGAFDWNSLLTCEDGCYEPGLFDLRAPTPRPTALSQMIRTLAAGSDFDHPALDFPGWWHRLDRFSYQPVTRRELPVYSSVQRMTSRGGASRPLLITGGSGTLGRAFARICEKRGIAYHLLSRADLDITDPSGVETMIDRFEPWAIINAAGYVRVDDAEREMEKCRRDNLEGPVNLAKHCARYELGLVTFSSDLVFDGIKKSAYVESDPTAALNVYGQSKAEAETLVLYEYPQALMIRTSCFFGPWDQFCFTHSVLETLAAGRIFRAGTDQHISPTYVPDLVHATLDVLIDGECGIWHLANSGALTWEDFALEVAGRAGYPAQLIQGVPLNSLGSVAIRPAHSVLASERASIMPPLNQAIDRYFHDSKQNYAAGSISSGRR